MDHKLFLDQSQEDLKIGRSTARQTFQRLEKTENAISNSLSLSSIILRLQSIKEKMEDGILHLIKNNSNLEINVLSTGIDLLLAGLLDHTKLMKDLIGQFDTSSHPICQTEKSSHAIGQTDKSINVIGQLDSCLSTNQETEPSKIEDNFFEIKDEKNFVIHSATSEQCQDLSDFVKIETDFTEHDCNASNHNYEDTAIENNQNDTFEVHVEEFKETILDFKENLVKDEENTEAKESFDKNSTNTDKYSCDICQKIFITKSRLSTHKRTHDSKRNKSKREAKKINSEKSTVSIPESNKCTNEEIKTENVQNITEEYNCNLCDQNFKTKYKFTQHERKHSGERPYSCDLCHKAFKDKQTLTIHMRTHTGEKPYCCDKCGRGFSQKTRLNEHMRTHTGEKPFECDVCHKFLSSKKSLQKHKRIHTGEKPFNCEKCGWAFRGMDNLIQHLQIHNGEKAFQCTDCDKSFYSNFRLNEHKRIHTGEKPFECDVCHKFFSTSRILNRHKIIHTGIKPYHCEACGKEFAHRFLLAKHTKVHISKVVGITN